MIWVALIALMIFTACSLLFLFIGLVQLRDDIGKLAVSSLNALRETRGRLDRLEGKES